MYTFFKTDLWVWCVMYLPLFVIMYLFFLYGQFNFFVNVYVMKRKFKQRWSIIPPISTKQIITSHLHSLNIKKDHVGNQCPGLGHAQTCGGVKSVNGILPSWLHVSRLQFGAICKFPANQIWWVQAKPQRSIISMFSWRQQYYI